MTDKLREKLINAGRVLVDEGQGDYVWGHISARLPENPNRFLMKAGCLGIEEMTEDNIITVDIEGEKVSGDWPRPPYSTRYRKAKARKGLTGSFGDRSWLRKAII